MKQLRLRRLMRHPSGRVIFCPLDHGVTLGPIEGIRDIGAVLQAIKPTRTHGVILHKGNLSVAAQELRNAPDLCVLMHLSASISLSPHSMQKVLVGSVEEAVRLGADAVSVHINIGCDEDRAMIESLGWVSGECERLGMPLLCMMYPRGAGLDEHSADANAICIRVAQELGADFIKVNYTGSPKSFERILEGTHVPVLISGGARRDEAGLLRDISAALAAGAGGVCIGRNVFQHPNPAQLLTAIERLVLDGIPLAEVLRDLKHDKASDRGACLPKNLATRNIKSGKEVVHA